MERGVSPQNVVASHARGNVVNHDGNHDTSSANTRPAIANGRINADSLSPVLHILILIPLNCRAPSYGHFAVQRGTESQPFEPKSKAMRDPERPSALRVLHPPSVVVCSHCDVGGAFENKL